MFQFVKSFHPRLFPQQKMRHLRTMRIRPQLDEICDFRFVTRTLSVDPWIWPVAILASGPSKSGGHRVIQQFHQTQQGLKCSAKQAQAQTFHHT